jgi:aspartyl-tRNA(Asn)/glutamyl-tRNA(Gln) amidotransferase subunit C
MPDDIGAAEVDRIARLARLALTDEEKALYARQLTRILEYARQIAALDTSGVSPTARVDEGEPAERSDEVRPSLPRDLALANAPESLAGLFIVPRAIAEE